MTVYTDRAAVKAVLGSPNLNGKHARWWNKVHGSGIREVDIVYRVKQNITHADAPSSQPVLLHHLRMIVLKKFRWQLSLVETMTTPLLIFYQDLLLDILLSFADRQYNDELLQPIIIYLKNGKLPDYERK